MPMPRKEDNPLPMTCRLLVSMEEAAGMLSLSYYTTTRMIKAGTLPSVKIGTVIRVPLRQLEEWIEKHTEGGNNHG